MMEWPETNPETGKPKTTATNQAILLAAAEAAEAALPDHVSTFRESLESVQNWRSDYIRIFEEFVRLQTLATPEVVDAMCQAGLQKAQESFVMRVDDEEATVSLTGAFEIESEPLKNVTYTGNKEDDDDDDDATMTPFQLASPHGSDAEPLWVTGQDAIAQVEAWKEYGCMEPSAAEHATATLQAKDASALVQKKTFCLLGITSQMGPTHSLLQIPGAHIMGIARGGSKLQKVVDLLKQHGSTNTTLQAPEGGADLLQQVPQIARWIVDNAPPDQPLVLVPLAYMDGEACVRVTVAMDAIVTYVQKHFVTQEVSLAYLISPATVCTLPPEAVQDAQRRYEEQEGSFSIATAASLVSFGTWAKPTNVWTATSPDDDNNMTIYNGIIHLQGPNYALAKTMQQWRCMTAHAAGLRVAAPLAPPTRTYSVVHSPEAAAALEGLNKFPPNLAFDVLPCSSLLTAIVLDQLFNSSASETTLTNHPLELFWDGAVHGGNWRCPYQTDSCGTVGYILGRTICQPGSSPEASLAPRPSSALKK